MRDNIKFIPVYGSKEIVDVPTPYWIHGVQCKGQVAITRDEKGNITNFEVCPAYTRIEIE